MQISEELRAFLQQASFAIVAVPLDLGNGEEAAVLVRTSRDAAETLRGAGARVEVGLLAENTPLGPAVCLLFRAEGAGSADLVGETYFDRGDPADDAIFELLSRQEVLRVAFLEEELDIVWVVEVPWGELRRLEAEQIWDRAEQWLEQTQGQYDFDAARQHVQNAFALDTLLDRAFARDSG